jgi:sulfite reductase (NADPH) flavoprotein alpha-component
MSYQVSDDAVSSRFLYMWPAHNGAVSSLPDRLADPGLDTLQQQLLALSAGRDGATLRYLAGFLAGVAAERERQAAPAAPSAASNAEQAQRVTVLFGSQTGNGRRVAEKLHRQLESQGLAARLVNAADFKTRDIATEKLLFLVVSTHGDGDPPDDARALFDYLGSRKAPRLEQLSYSVLALGDSSYPKYCETGRVLDERLHQLGARRLQDLVPCDVDFQASADQWTGAALRQAREHLQVPHLAIVSTAPLSKVADRDTPVEVELLTQQRITARTSDHPVHHLELAAPAGSFDYEPGDAVGIWHENPSFVVERIAELLGTDLDAAVRFDGREASLRDWLTRQREITRLTRPFLEAHAARSADAELRALLESGTPDAVRTLLRDWQPIDLLERYPTRWNAEELVASLRPLTPRLYSIASSRAAVGDELHMTVAPVDYQHHGQRRVGAASWYLSQLAADGTQKVRAYLEPNTRFRLPQDGHRDIIMIGPGTGVAPFRGFLQQRVEAAARGRNWLFFGARHLFSDFLYQSEWLEARRNGTLQRLDVAFSRDQSRKLYVQDRMREHGAELARWIENGAHVYVCGDANRMAPDVHAALLDVLTQHTARNADDAEEYLQSLAQDRRYVRDVY